MNLCHMFLFFVDATTGNPSFSAADAPVGGDQYLMLLGVGS